MPPRLVNVIRLDSMPLSKAMFTPEGYLKDRPVLTSIGIFEYGNPDGSTRRELRLPEDVFDSESLKSYRGKPIILTHDAGLVTKNNVAENQIGTILSDGMKSGDDVIADIIIHDTDAMKDSGLKELSLGYNLDLDETPGVWNGQHYDAIQRNIRINHLALVREARAGEQARLNIDGRDSETLIGGKVMRKTTPVKTRRYDGILSPEELAKAIEEYKARRQMAEKTDADEEEVVVEEKEVPVANEMPEDIEGKAAFLKEKKDHRDEEPETDDELKEMLARQDEDMDTLFDIIDTLLAEKAFDEAGEEAEKEEQDPEAIIKDADDDDSWMEEEEEVVEEEPEKEDSEEGSYDEILKTNKDAKKHCDEDEEEIPEMTEEEVPEEEIPEEENEDSEDDVIPNTNKGEINMDAIDRIVSQKIKLGMIGRQVNLDGLERMSIPKAKKAIIKAVRPNVRLDGKSDAYINAMFSCAVADIKERTKKDTRYQKRQMFNKDSKVEVDKTSAAAKRDQMIKRHSN